MIEDITNRLALERQLADAHKLEAVGRLAGGIAHDFNNLLTAVSGYAELIRFSNERSAPDVRAEIDESVDVIVDAAGRGADLTRQLLTFSRLHTFSPQEIDTPELLDRTEQLLRRVIGSLVTLEVRIDPAAPAIFADPSQMDQVLLNLALNARDAMPDGGTLTLTLGRWTPAESDSPRYAAIAPGEYCRITVGDTGVGMDPETLERIFEPFFTTKEVGKGTGLGLATSYGIVTSIDGHLLVCSAPGDGDRVRDHHSRVVRRCDGEHQLEGPGSPGGAGGLGGDPDGLDARRDPSGRAAGRRDDVERPPAREDDPLAVR